MSQNPYGSYGNNQPEEPKNPYQADPQTFEAQNKTSEQTHGSYAAPQQPSNGQPSNNAQSHGYAQPTGYQQQYQPGGYQQQNSAYAGGSPYATNNSYASANTYGGAAETCAPRPHVGVGGAFSRWAKNLVHFSGRASRSEFWWVYGGFMIISGILSSIFGVFTAGIATKMEAAQRAYENSAQTTENYNKLNDYNTELASQMLIWMLLIGLFSFVLLLLMLSLYWRRLQDAGFHGAISLLVLTGFGAIVPFVMAFFPSSPKGCKYDKPADANRP